MNTTIDVILLGFAFLVLLFSITIITYFNHKRNKYQIVIYESLTNLLNKEADIDLSLLKSLLDSMGRKANASYSIQITLEAYISHLLTTEQNATFFIKHKTLLRQLLDEAKSKKPFDSCPDPEKMLLEHLSDLNKQKPNDNLTPKLKELGDQISIRYSEYQKVDRNNKLMIWITVVSAVVGLFSFIVGFIK